MRNLNLKDQIRLLATFCIVLCFFQSHSQTHFFEDAVSSGTIFHSNGSEPDNPLFDRGNNSSTIMQNGGSAGWERTELYPDDYTISANDNLYVSFYNPNNASGWQLQLAFDDGAFSYAGDINHESSSGWYEIEFDLSSYDGDNLTGILIYPSAGESKSMSYDAVYISTQTALGNLFSESSILSLFHSDGSTTSNPTSDAINHSSNVIIDNSGSGWSDVQWFPSYEIQTGDDLFISFYNPNNASGWQLRMDLSTSGTSTYIGDFTHESDASSGWVESRIDLSTWEGETISKIQLYPSAGGTEVIYLDNVYLSTSSQEANYWTGGTSTDWTNTANWQGSYVPTSLSNVTVKTGSNQPAITGDLEIQDIVLEGDLQLSSGASLAIMGTASGTGTATVLRNIAGSDGYSIIGTPVTGTSIADLTGQGTNLIYDYDGSDWVSVTSGSLEPGKGYFAAQVGVGSPSVSLAGSLASGDIDANVSTAGDGFNILANPYAAAISASDFITADASANVTTGAIYVWDDGGTNSGGDRAGTYRVVNDMGTSDFTNIGSVQGFFVEADNGGTVTFTPDMQVTTSGANADGNFYRKAQSEKQILKLSITGETVYEETSIGFVQGATVDRDYGLDATYLPGNEFISFYSLMREERLAIQGLPIPQNDPVEVRLGADIKEAGSYTLSVEVFRGFGDYTVSLLDKLTGKTHTLDQEAQLPFRVTETSDSQRFAITIAPKVILTTLDQKENMLTIASINHSELVINYESNQTEQVTIYSLDGRSIRYGLVDFESNQAVIANPNLLKDQVYILSVDESSIKFMLK